jgi:hypothetical protein
VGWTSDADLIAAVFDSTGAAEAGTTNDATNKPAAPIPKANLEIFMISLLEKNDEVQCISDCRDNAPHNRSFLAAFSPSGARTIRSQERVKARMEHGEKETC